MTVQQITDWLDGIAPFSTAEAFDNVGLLIGNGQKPVQGVLFGLDITEELLAQALSLGTNLIITHHPFIFSGVKRIDTDAPFARELKTILVNDLQIVAAHTNWDKARGGVSDTLADVLGMENPSSVDDYLRRGSLSCSMSAGDFSEYVAERLHVQVHLYGPDRMIRTFATAPGAYGEAVSIASADALVTGEFHHHQLLEGTGRGMVLVCAEHYATEFPGIAALKDRFLQTFASSGVKAVLHTQVPFAGALRL